MTPSGCKRWFTLLETYGIAIAPGQDEVLMLSAAVCIDEMSEEQRNHKPEKSLPAGGEVGGDVRKTRTA